MRRCSSVRLFVEALLRILRRIWPWSSLVRVLPVKVLYAEKSYRPAPTEVTYIPHSPVREYDYYAILELGGDAKGERAGLALPFLIEGLTIEYEYGGKTAADKLLGVSMPVMFMYTEDSSTSDTGDDAKVKERKEREKCQGIVCPSRSAWTLPVALGLEFSKKLKNELDSFSSRTLYVPLVAKDFWDELVESQIVFAPSVYVKYVVEPLFTLSKNILSKMQSKPQSDMEVGDEIYKLFWANLYLRTKVELCAHKGECGNTAHVELEKLEDFYAKKGQTLATNTLLKEVGKCSDITVVLVIPRLEESVELARRLGLRLSPPIATLATPILHVAYVVKSSRSAHLNIVIVHDYGERYREERNQIKMLKEYIKRVLREYRLKGFIVDEVYVGTLFSQVKEKEDPCKSLENKLGKMLCRRECAVLVVRDTKKEFLKNLLDFASKMFEHVYFIYAGETTPIYAEKACSPCVESSPSKSPPSLKKNSRGKSSSSNSSRQGFPIASLLVYFSACMDKNEKEKKEKMEMEKLIPVGSGCEGKLQREIFGKCDTSSIVKIVDCFVRTSFVDVFRIK